MHTVVWEWFRPEPILQLPCNCIVSPVASSFLRFSGHAEALGSWGRHYIEGHIQALDLQLAQKSQQSQKASDRRLNKMWELGSEPTSGSLMVRMSCLQNMVRHVCNICQKANEEQFRRAAHWCKHVTDGDGNTHSWVHCWWCLHSTLPVPRLEDWCRIRWPAFHGWQKQHLPANPGRRCLSWDPIDPIQLLTLHLHTASTKEHSYIMRKSWKVYVGVCSHVTICYLLWRLVMPCRTYWWQTPPNLPAAQKKQVFQDGIK